MKQPSPYPVQVPAAFPKFEFSTSLVAVSIADSLLPAHWHTTENVVKLLASKVAAVSIL